MLNVQSGCFSSSHTTKTNEDTLPERPWQGGVLLQAALWWSDMELSLSHTPAWNGDTWKCSDKMSCECILKVNVLYWCWWYKQHIYYIYIFLIIFFSMQNTWIQIHFVKSRDIHFHSVILQINFHIHQNRDIWKHHNLICSNLSSCSQRGLWWCNDMCLCCGWGG